MKVLFIHQYFRTPQEGGGIRSYYMCKALKEKGYEVTVISAHNQKKHLIKEIEGIEVRYLPVYYENSLGFLGRIYAFLKFLILSTFWALRYSADCIYTSSSPLTVGITGMVVKGAKKIPFIFEVMDLWPEAPIQMGFIKNPLLKRFLRWVEKKIYENANLVVAASPGMEEGVKAASPGTKTVMIPNMSDCAYFYPHPKSYVLTEKYKVSGKFVCCYTGAIGLSNKLEELLNLASYLKSKKIFDIHFIIAGEGSSLQNLRVKAKEYQLDNISFLGYLSKEQVREVYNVSDLNLVFFSSEKILETNSPNKFFDGLAAGLPALVNIHGWIKEICEAKQCGKYFNRQNPEEFVVIVQNFQKNKNLHDEFKKNARKLAEQEFNKDVLLKNYLKIFESL